MFRQSLLVPALAAMLLVAACDDEDPTGVAATSFAAQLGGAAEVPPVTTSGTGTATFQIDGDEIDFVLNTTGLTNVTAAHIHGPAGAGVNADVIVPLFLADVEGAWNGSKSGSFDVTDLASGQNVSTMSALISLMRAGNTYVNVHTAAYPDGEVRGQIAGS